LSLESLFHWIQSTDWATYIRESALLYPMIMTTHLACIAFFGGLIVTTDLRLLGVIMTDTPAPQLISRLRPWKWFGFLLMITCGILLASSKADTYYPNPYFRMKMLLLAMVGVHAMAFHGSVYGRRAPASGGMAKAAGVLSLALWLGVLSMGRWIAYYEPPK
jgi:hypothetical protein